MKRLTKLMVIVALGVATQSCQEDAYNEVEETVLENEMKSVMTDGDKELEDKPGQN